jgi:glycosyltransferase involved in cell wall biosynthesis
MITTLNISDRVFQENLTDFKLVTIYSQSFATIVPSLYEGFCLPLIESMSCSCPVVYSNSSCLPEIAGNAGIQFLANDASSLIKNLDRLLNDTSFYQNQIDLGKSRSSEFSWNKCASKFIYIFTKYYNSDN